MLSDFMKINIFLNASKLCLFTSTFSRFSIGFFIFCFTFWGCSQNPPQPSAIQIVWSPNRETAVNSAGGGYNVYYSQTQGFNIVDALGVVNVPYSSGTLAPTSASIADLTPGVYYLKVVAYSALVPPGQSTGAVSAPSSEVSVTLPQAQGN